MLYVYVCIAMMRASPIVILAITDRREVSYHFIGFVMLRFTLAELAALPSLS